MYVPRKGGSMTSHELANKLIDMPDRPIYKESWHSDSTEEDDEYPLYDQIYKVEEELVPNEGWRIII
jgi:hypothetical protein